MPIIEMQEATFFSLWEFQFRKQLKGLWEAHCIAKDENEEVVNITFLDFCLKLYARRTDVIDYSQN